MHIAKLPLSTTFICDKTDQIEKSTNAKCFPLTLGGVPVYGVLIEECSQHFDHHYSVSVHLFCYRSSAFPGK